MAMRLTEPGFPGLSGDSCRMNHFLPLSLSKWQAGVGQGGGLMSRARGTCLMYGTPLYFPIFKFFDYPRHGNGRVRG